jgi:hypothetical protein
MNSVEAVIMIIRVAANQMYEYILYVRICVYMLVTYAYMRIAYVYYMLCKLYLAPYYMYIGI